MFRAYSLDLRERVVAAIARGKSCAGAAGPILKKPFCQARKIGLALPEGDIGGGNLRAGLILHA
jgi:hypothetical protein